MLGRNPTVVATMKLNKIMLCHKCLFCCLPVANTTQQYSKVVNWNFTNFLRWLWTFCPEGQYEIFFFFLISALNVSFFFDEQKRLKLRKQLFSLELHGHLYCIRIPGDFQQDSRNNNRLNKCQSIKCFYWKLQMPCQLERTMAMVWHYCAK